MELSPGPITTHGFRVLGVLPEIVSSAGPWPMSYSFTCDPLFLNLLEVLIQLWGRVS